MYRKLIVLSIGVLSFAVASSPTLVFGDEDDEGGGNVFLVDQVSRPDVPSYRINSFDTDRALDALMGVPTTAGMEVSKGVKQVAPTVAPCVWFCNPSFYLEYDYINSQDQRVFGADSETHSAVVGFDFSTIDNILLGITYSYSNRDADLSPIGLPDNEDSHFVSLYAAKSFAQWFNIGVSGGYGFTSTEVRGLDSGDEDTWSISPFVGVAHSWGAFSASLTVSSIHTWSSPHDSGVNVEDDTGKIGVGLKVGYAVTEKLKVQLSAKFVDIVYNESVNGLGEDHDWVTFGGKTTYRVSERFDVYLGYYYDAFNDTFHNHNVQVGLLASW